MKKSDFLNKSVLITILYILFHSSDLLTKSQISAINESLESINNELTWTWNENELVVPQCEDIENNQLKQSTFVLDW